MIIRPLMQMVLKEFEFDFIAKRNIATIFSLILILGTFISLATQGLNYGIDFAGGVRVEARVKEGQLDIATLRNALEENVGDVELSTIGNEGKDVTIRVPKQDGGEEAQTAALKKVQGVLGDNYEIRSTEVVGPKVGGELVINGSMAIALSLIGIAIYVWIRFEWQFALGALLSLTHDVISIIGIFSVFQIQFDLNTVAAVLTITGISINDTVVVYDRVREMLRKYKRLSLPDLLNLSLNKVLARTMMTNVTVALGVAALLVGGGDVLFGFTLALMWGVFVGSFSTIYTALPVLVYFDLRHDEMSGQVVSGSTKTTPQAERQPV